VIAGRYDGMGGHDSYVMRITAGGVLDEAGFGTGGIFTIDQGGNDQAHDIAVQEGENKVVVVGSYHTGEHYNMYALRLNEDGTLDDDSDASGFGGDGIATVNWSDQNDIANAIALGPDGTIYAGGLTQPATGPRDVAIARFTSDGRLDDSWSGDGKVRASFPGSSDDGVYGLALQPDGKLAAAAFGNGEGFKLARFLPSGQLDPGFGTDGMTIRRMSPESGGGARAMALYGNRRLVVAGDAYKNGGNDFAVMRLLTAKGATETTLELNKKDDKLVVSGKVTPNHEGESVTVKLFKKKDGDFRLVDSKDDKLSATSRYTATFSRPDASRCKVIARFPGDAHHKPSTASEGFAC
jgi:uncharacterized delta-60 repeat protein